MAWTIPKTWTANEVPDESDFNTHIRDNLNALKSPPFTMTALNVTALNATGNSTAFTALTVGATVISAVLTTYGGDILVHFDGAFICDGNWAMNLTYNGTAWTSAVHGFGQIYSGRDMWVSWDRWVTGLPSGTHTFVPQWLRIDAAAPKIMPTGQANFWVREVS